MGEHKKVAKAVVAYEIELFSSSEYHTSSGILQIKCCISVHLHKIANSLIFFDRQERMETDCYLETREKENVFLQKVLDTIERGLRFAGGPDYQEHENTTEPNTASSAFHAESECAESDKERRETEESLLDFIDSF